jgi:two-component system, OmpR family, response regulator RegX3
VRDDTYAAVKDLLERTTKLLARIEREERQERNTRSQRNGASLGIVFDRPALRVWVDHREVFLTATEMRIFMLLVDHEGEVVPHEAILETLEEMHPSLPADTRSPAVHIGRLRQKLELDPSQPSRIVSVRGFGYRFENANGA